MQELQANPAIVKLHLQNIFTNGVVEMDVTPEGRTGSAIVVASNLEVLDHGHKGDSTFSWV